jgi:hypothetical protein
METGVNMMAISEIVSSYRIRTRVAFLAALTLLSACTFSISPFDEPLVRGKVIDQDTLQPLQGVIVYGFYVTAEGSIAGGTVYRDVVRSFETQTDAAGVFEIPAWNSGYQLVRGQPRGEFPKIGFYKGGYNTKTDALATLRRWYPQGPIAGERVIRAATASNNGSAELWDWTARPMALTQAKTEKQRYDAIIDAGDAFRFADSDGACGWERHVGLLVALHVEWKDFLRRNVPPESLAADGYPKSNFFHPDLDLRNRLQTRSGIDRMFDFFSKDASGWKCKDPKQVFGAVQK